MCTFRFTIILFTILLFTIYYLRKEFNCMSTLKTLTNYTQYAPQLSFFLSYYFFLISFLSLISLIPHFSLLIPCLLPLTPYVYLRLTPHSLPLTSYSLLLS